MANDNQNQTNDNKISELKPVKSPLAKILTVGTKLAVGGAVIAFVGHLLFVPKLMGASRTARLNYEQKKAEIQQQLAEEVQKEIDEKE